MSAAFRMARKHSTITTISSSVKGGDGVKAVLGGRVTAQPTSKFPFPLQIKTRRGCAHSCSGSATVATQPEHQPVHGSSLGTSHCG